MLLTVLLFVFETVHVCFGCFFVFITGTVLSHPECGGRRRLFQPSLQKRPLPAAMGGQLYLQNDAILATATPVGDNVAGRRGRYANRIGQNDAVYRLISLQQRLSKEAQQ